MDSINNTMDHQDQQNSHLQRCCLQSPLRYPRGITSVRAAMFPIGNDLCMNFWDQTTLSTIINIIVGGLYPSLADILVGSNYNSSNRIRQHSAMLPKTDFTNFCRYSSRSLPTLMQNMIGGRTNNRDREIWSVGSLLMVQAYMQQSFHL